MVKSRLAETGSNSSQSSPGQISGTTSSSAPSSGQNSSLQMTSSGELVRYEWSDGSGSLLVVPKNDFLLEKITTSALQDGRTAVPHAQHFGDSGQQFFCSSRSADLALSGLRLPDRERRPKVPAGAGGIWSAGASGSRRRCGLRVELVGREKLTIRGTERELLRLNLKGESFSWALWVDEKDQFKLMRVLIADDNTEVVRD